MLTHLGLSAWVSPVNLTLGRVIHQALAFLGIRLLLEAQYNTACTELSGLPRELRWERGSAKIRRHMTGPLRDLELKTKLENHTPQLTWNIAEKKTKQIPTSVLNPWTLQFCQWISRTVEAAPKKILTLGKLRRCSLQMSINPSCKQRTSNKNVSDDLLMTLNASLQPWPLSKAPDVRIHRPLHSSTYMTNRQLKLPRPQGKSPDLNTWFSMDLTTFLFCKTPYQ